MGQTGCVSFMFDQKGVIIIEKDGADEDELTLDALESGADDFENCGDYYEITTAPSDFHTVRDNLEKKYTISSAEISMIPQTTVSLTDEKQILMMSKLLENLEDNDDVQNVYHNWDAPEEDEEE